MLLSKLDVVGQSVGESKRLADRGLFLYELAYGLVLISKVPNRDLGLGRRIDGVVLKGESLGR